MFCLLQDQQYTGRSGGLGSDPSPTYGAAGQVALEARTPLLCLRTCSLSHAVALQHG